MKHIPSMFPKRGVAIALAALGLGLAGQAMADIVLPGSTTVQFKYTNYDAFFDKTGALVNPLSGTPIVVGDTLTEIFSVASIGNVSSTKTFFSANEGVSLLTGIETGLTVTSLTASTSGGFDLTLSGGAITMYLLGPTGTFTPTAATQSMPALQSQVCGGACPTAWLTLDNVAGIVSGDTSTTIFSHISLATSPSTGHGSGLLKVTGGTDASVFGIGAIASLESDLQTCAGATGTFAAKCAILPNGGTSGGDWTSVSNDPVLIKTVPEPASLALLGLGLTALGLARRRTKKA